MGDDPVYSECMIRSYCDAEAMEISQSIGNPNFIRLSKADPTRFLSSRERDSLTKKYHDYHWQRNVALFQEYTTYSNEFTGITVISNADFNGIPAGQPLDSKVRIVALSPYRWLKSESLLTYDWSEAPSDYDVQNDHGWLYSRYYWHLPPEVFPVNKTLTDLVPEDLLLLFEQSLYLLFTETPEIKEHNLRITFKNPRKDVVAEGVVRFK